MKIGKRGNVTDVLVIVVILFIIALLFPFVYSFITDFNADVQADSDISDNSKAFTQQAATQWPVWTDNAFVLIFVLSWGFVLVTSFMIDSHPIFFIFSLLIMVFIIYFAMTLSNAYQEMITQDTDYSDFVAAYPKTIFIFTHLGQLVTAIVFSIAIVLYGKMRQNG